MRMKTLGFMAAAIAAALACDAQGDMDLYLLIGQSNMAGRGVLTDSNRVSAEGIFKLDAAGEWQAAEEPIHFAKPTIAGAGLAADQLSLVKGHRRHGAPKAVPADLLGQLGG